MIRRRIFFVKNAKNAKRNAASAAFLPRLSKKGKVYAFGKEDSYERNPGRVSFVLDQ